MANKKERKAASERVRAMQAQQAAAERRRRTLIVGAVVVAVIAVVVGVGIAVQSGRTGPTSGTAPAGVTSDNGVLRDGKTGPVQVVVYEDFQCPSCKAFEENVGSTLAQDVTDGQIQLEYRPIAFLDRASTTKYSSRALATAACALDDGGPAVFTKLHDLLFANQPAEGSAGLTDGQLADLAAQAGANKSTIASCQSAGTYDGWAAMVTDNASKAGVTGTPTYFVDGKQVAFSNSEDPKITLTKLIDAAAAQQ